MERKVRVESDSGKSWVSAIGLVVIVAGFLFDATLGTADSVPMAAPGVFLAGFGGLVLLLGMIQSKFTDACSGINLMMITLCAWSGYLFIRIQFSPVVYLADLDLFLLVSAFSGLAVGVVHPDKTMVSKIFTFGVILGVLLNAWAAAQQFMAGESISPLESLGLSVMHSGVRCTGLFYHANPFGCFSALASLWLFFNTFNSSFGKLLRILCLVVCCVGVFCVWSSLSRAAFGATALGLCAGGGVMFFGWMRSRDQWKGKLAVVLGLIVMIIVVVGGAVYAGKGMLDRRGIEGKEFGKVTDVSGREIPWITSMEMFVDAPLVGHGSRGFYRNENTYMSRDWHGGAPNFEHPHNEFLEQLTDYGLAGLGLGVIALICLLFGAIALAISSDRLTLMKSRNPLRAGIGKMALPTSAGAVAVIVACLVDGMYSFNMHFVPNVFLVGGITGMLLGVKNRVFVFSEDYSESSGRSNKGGMPLVTLCVLVVGLMVLSASGMNTGARYAIAWWPLQLAKRDFNEGEISGEALLDVMIRKAENIDRYPFLYRSGVRCRIMAEHHDGYDDEERMALMKKSADHLLRACELAPFDVVSHRDCAKTLLRLGRFDEAEEYQQKALELGWNREYHFNNSFDLAQIQYMQALAAINNANHVEASAALRRASQTLERGRSKLKRNFRERVEILKKNIEQEIAFLKRTESWIEEPSVSDDDD